MWQKRFELGGRGSVIFWIKDVIDGAKRQYRRWIGEESCQIGRVRSQSDQGGGSPRIDKDFPTEKARRLVDAELNAKWKQRLYTSIILIPNSGSKNRNIKNKHFCWNMMYYLEQKSSFTWAKNLFRYELWTNQLIIWLVYIIWLPALTKPACIGHSNNFWGLWRYFIKPCRLVSYAILCQK